MRAGKPRRIPRAGNGTGQLTFGPFALTDSAYSGRLCLTERWRNFLWQQRTPVSATCSAHLTPSTSHPRGLGAVAGKR